MLIAETQGVLEMAYFLDTVETIVPGVGFDLFGTQHVLWLAVFLVVVAVNCLLYGKLEERGRGTWRKSVAVLVVLNEVFKHVCLLIGGNFMAKYLPLHLCSINIFLIAIHAWRPSKVLDNFLYLVCIPGALAALLFPSWGALPVTNFMYWHSFTVHILLAMYPIVLTAAGDIRPQLREFPKSLGLLLAMVVPIAVFNVVFDTNFMFLMYPEPGNPLLWFQEHWGNHLYGYPILLAAVMAVMAVPAYLLGKRRNQVQSI